MAKGDMTMISDNRRRYLIKKAFQLRYTAVILFFVFLTAIISSAVIYLAIFPYLSEKLAAVYPQGRLMLVLKDANLKVLMSTAFILPFGVWLGILLTHRIAGPWYRLESILREVAKGNFEYEVKLRKTDELKSLADAINDMTRGLRVMSQQGKEGMRSLEETLQALREEFGREPIDIMKSRLLLSKLQDISAELKAISAGTR